MVEAAKHPLLLIGAGANRKSTRDIDTAMRCYNRLEASAVMVNEHTAFRVDWMPFAGLKHSGYGIGGIQHTMRDMQVEKMLVIKSKAL
jgi:acyl-CoA reductase-like NAD-dependent aldehyde dehydrogenase